MRRRDFITVLAGAAAQWPLAARAQPVMPVVGFLSGRSPGPDAELVTAFRQGLDEAGFIDGRNVAIEFRWAEGQSDRLMPLAADLVGRQAAVIFVGGADVRMSELRAAIFTIPMVFATGGDPVALGLVASLNRPGGNATGATSFSHVLWPKRLDLVRELVPKATGIAILVNPSNPNAAIVTREVQAAARDIGRNVLVLNASSDRDFDTVFATLVHARVGALLVMDDQLFIRRRDKLVALVALHAVPTIYGRREFIAAGGLMSYGASTIDQYRQCGLYAGRILKGAKPADLPVLQPTKFDLVINLKTAKALGLAVPPALLVRADEVLE